MADIVTFITGNFKAHLHSVSKWCLRNALHCLSVVHFLDTKDGFGACHVWNIERSNRRGFISCDAAPLSSSYSPISSFSLKEGHFMFSLGQM